MKNRTFRIIALLLACIMLSGITACREQPNTEPTPTPTVQDPTPTATPEDDYIPEGDKISAGELAVRLKEKYANTAKAEYQESLWNVPCNQEFFADFAFDLVEDTEYRDFMDVYAVYADAELTTPVSTAWEIVTHEDDPSIPEGHNRVYARPGKNASGRVWGSYYDLITREEITLDEAGEYYLHERAEYESWGFLKHYYLVQHIDAVTAEPLKKPLVTIFTIENQLDAPQSEFYVTEDGKAAFRWNEVAGADYYLIVEINDYSVLRIVDKAVGTHWEYPHKADSVMMNQRFSGVGFVTDDYMTDMPGDVERSDASYNNYSVIAVNSETHSPLGSIHRGDDIASRLPYSLAYNTNRQDAEESGGNTKYIPAVGLLPTHKAISMADGTTVYRRMIYDYNSAEIKEDRWVAYDGYDSGGNMINARYEDHINLHIDFEIESTMFADKMVVTDVDPATAMQELKAFRKMHDATAPRSGGSAKKGVSEDKQKPDSKTSEDAPDEILDRSGDRIFANSALSEYLALNLLAANELIDLSEFPESADWEYLLDAFLEAMYQNPLVLHVAGAGSAPGTNLLVVEYSEPARKIYEQQKALRDIIPKIISEIITTGMTDLEKSFAINEYLIETSEYDWAALENAEKNNFQGVDERFNDSFTAYGILIGKVGVCAGYAAAFKLLADEAGLDAIVVTGYLEGILPHAWNRVNIDGYWHTVDVTNNANEYLFNVFMNLPDSAAGRTLIEDSCFMMDAFIGQYRSTDNNSEYYNVTGLLFDKGDIAAELASLISQNGSATLRTDYNLDDDDFYDIAMEVLEILKTNELYGFFMLGVIWMSDSV